ncbi:segregation and condensation protein B [Clostridium acetobutylicum]|uniref:Segregation and condensation protein B n=1 Tax=Clostridium acetobutylicum (strain ATCC 824 / DSM 792 / JCM 1419 / IAM 19013 / LMG 5710 / NBRC 13948 / NRRL B-527 / VKM B-1787 / 2291 / W) TaxID=272562 RepID=SCPB_CLOAB|nr:MULTISPECIES: SMC-Scp complex subunit ScpB [Clostridium]Q97HF1.1 RecName: Full=Segregation and condensation protein B [Clostridium acetobutylicum ATCC 824]AAK80019.1 Predicted transciptinal regulator (HTH-type), YPUH B.subtilis ortholog [Clostridium acetobutylicum ATCC 824]ADZ21111.1 segregation and condensation protein B [Clostridium acetobutylicum EA 2018]AEI33610.1 segregation and condensation protein B [Clostridium acetobutylicum DSM 1731]AWV79552.1 segregation/condensation protein B [C
MNKINESQLEMDEISKKELHESIIESLLFVSGEPLKLKQISAILECTTKRAQEVLNNMMLKYNDNCRGVKLININDSYQLVTKNENSDYVRKLLKTNTRQALSQAALETLAIIAYKQPITRIDVDEIRGVKSDRAILTLQEKKLIQECGRLDVPGRPILYETTDEFLKNFNLGNIDELPPMEQIASELDEVAVDEEVKEGTE